jgi:hypothetical protein
MKPPEQISVITPGGPSASGMIRQFTHHRQQHLLDRSYRPDEIG